MNNAVDVYVLTCHLAEARCNSIVGVKIMHFFGRIIQYNAWWDIMVTGAYAAGAQSHHPVQLKSRRTTVGLVSRKNYFTCMQ